MTEAEVLQEQYRRRFHEAQAYRDGVWRAILDGFLQAQIGENQSVLDLGCGWGEFSRNVRAGKKFAMDLNPDARSYLGDDVSFLQQDCSQPWQMPDGSALPDASLDVVFSSNFIEHLPDKSAVEATFAEVHRSLKPGGKFILMGPNIRYVGGAYWDYWDHHVAISDNSLVEVLQLKGFEPQKVVPRFLPYTMSGGRQAPLAFVRLYLALPVFWPLLGKQFFVVANAVSEGGA